MIYTLLAATCWASVNIIDKYTLSNLVKSPLIPIFILSLVGLISGIFILALNNFPTMAPVDLILALVAGALYLVVMFFYYQAVKQEEISRVIPLYYLSPVFVLLGSWLFLSESVTKIELIAILLLVFGAIFISIKPGKNLVHNKAALYMLLASIVYAGNQIVTKFLLNSNQFWTVFAYGRIGLLITLAPILYLKRREIKESFQNLSYPPIAIMSFNQVLNVSGIFLITIALTKAYAGLVNGLASVQPLLVLVISTLLSIFLPNIIKENIERKELGRKLLALVAILAGTFLISG
ncbi:MAG TPA: EamA family transporter [Coxiellaceae bacterium]|nr:EamA family transporter [Coxiellaceae bacterium]